MDLFAIDQNLQFRVEATVQRIIRRAHAFFSFNHVSSLDSIGIDDEQKSLYLLAHLAIVQDFEDLTVLCEGDVQENDESRFVLVASPITSSSSHRVSPFVQPIVTQLMIVHDGVIVALAIGDILKQFVYGVGDSGAYMFHAEESKKKQVVSVFSPSHHVRLAAYCPTKKYVRFLPLFTSLLDSGVLQFFHNSGGAAYCIEVSRCIREGFNCTIELRPRPLYDLVGCFFALRAGAIVSRLDGSALIVDPFIRQTAIVSVNDQIHSTMLFRLRPMFDSNGHASQL